MFLLKRFGFLFIYLFVIIFSSYAVGARPLSLALDIDNSGFSPTASIAGKQLANYHAFSQKIQNQGSIPILILLTEPTQSESSLRVSSKIINQRNNISIAQDQIESFLNPSDINNVKRYKTDAMMAMTVNQNALEDLIDSGRVKVIYEDILLDHTLDNSVPLINAHNLAFTNHNNETVSIDGDGITIAILDSGVDNNHDFLFGSVVSEACYSSGINGGVSLCNNNSTSSGSGANCTLYDGCDHGTHIAGIATGGNAYDSNNFGGRNGVAPKADIISINVFSYYNGRLTTSVSDVKKGLERVYNLRNTFVISSVNLSLGISIGYNSYYDSTCDVINGTPEPLKSNIDLLRNEGIATIIASGNNSKNGETAFPACISSAVTVGATNETGTQVYSTSNHAEWVDLLAPGESISSSTNGSGFIEKTGTSMATPHVAGCFALIKQVFPEKSINDIESALKKSTSKNLSRDGISVSFLDCGATISYLINSEYVWLVPVINLLIL